MQEFWALLNKYNRREQTLLLGLAVFLVVYILWVAVLSPLQNKRDRLVLGNAAAAEDLSKVQIMSAQIQQLRSSGAQPGSTDNINSLVNHSLISNGLKLDGFQPGSNGDVRVRLEAARYDTLMQWLYEIEYQHGISVLELSLSETRDAGLVTVNIRLQKI